MGDQTNAFERFLNRFRGARDNGRGNAFVRNTRAFFHATDPYGMPMDERGTIGWGESLTRAPAAIAGVSPFMGGDSPYDNYGQRPSTGLPRPNVIRDGRPAGAGTAGSVVGRGFIGIGGPQGLTHGPARPSRSESLGIAQMPIDIRRVGTADDLDPSFSRPENARDFVGGGSGIDVPGRGGRGQTASRANHLGAGALGSAGDAFLADMAESTRTRRGMMQEY